MVKHSLASSEYNTRKMECEAGVELIKKYYPKVNSLRDISLEQLDKHKSEMEAKVYDRCWYVVSENKRLSDACKALS